MALKNKLRRITRLLNREMVTFQLEDGTTARFHEDEFLDCCLHEWERGRRHYFGEEPGRAHPIIEALRRVPDEELNRIFSENGMLLEHAYAHEHVMRVEIESPGPPVRGG